MSALLSSPDSAEALTPSYHAFTSLFVFDMWGGLPKIRGTIWGVPIIRLVIFGALHQGPPTWEITMSAPPQKI